MNSTAQHRNWVNASGLLALFLAAIMVLSGCNCGPPSNEWRETPIPPLPEGSPTGPPVITGAATLPVYTGNGVMCSGSEKFYLTPPPYYGWEDMSVMDIIATSDAPIYFNERKSGCIRIELIQDLSIELRGGYVDHSREVIIDNEETYSGEGTVYTTQVRLRIEADNPANPWFVLELMSYDPAQEHEVSWEVYVWE